VVESKDGVLAMAKSGLGGHVKSWRLYSLPNRELVNGRSVEALSVYRLGPVGCHEGGTRRLAGGSRHTNVTKLGGSDKHLGSM
jgi:hypothetical protein